MNTIFLFMFWFLPIVIADGGMSNVMDAENEISFKFTWQEMKKSAEL